MNNLATDSNEELLTVDHSHWGKQAEALGRLRNKTFFKNLIEEGYFQNYVNYLLSQLIDRKVVEQGHRNRIVEKLAGVAKLQEYFNLVEAMASDEDRYEALVAEEEMKQRNRLTKLEGALERAKKDKDFKLVIEESYLDIHAKNQLSLLTNDVIIDGGHRGDVLETLAGISTFTNFIVDSHKDIAQMQQDIQEETTADVEE